MIILRNKIYSDTDSNKGKKLKRAGIITATGGTLGIAQLIGNHAKSKINNKNKSINKAAGEYLGKKLDQLGKVHNKEYGDVLDRNIKETKQRLKKQGAYDKFVNSPEFNKLSKEEQSKSLADFVIKNHVELPSEVRQRQEKRVGKLLQQQEDQRKKLVKEMEKLSNKVKEKAAKKISRKAKIGAAIGAATALGTGAGLYALGKKKEKE